MQYNVYYNEQYMASDYAFDTTRKSGQLATAIGAGEFQLRSSIPALSPSRPQISYAGFTPVIT